MGFASIVLFKFSSDPITEVSLDHSAWLYCHITAHRITQMLCNIFQTDGEVQRGSEDVGEVKDEYVGGVLTWLRSTRVNQVQLHTSTYGLDRIGHADNVKHETSRGEAEEKSPIKVCQIPLPDVWQQRDVMDCKERKRKRWWRSFCVWWLWVSKGSFCLFLFHRSTKYLNECICH